jgi:hypothetical protein
MPCSVLSGAVPTGHRWLSKHWADVVVHDCMPVQIPEVFAALHQPSRMAWLVESSLRPLQRMPPGCLCASFPG